MGILNLLPVKQTQKHLLRAHAWRLFVQYCSENIFYPLNKLMSAQLTSFCLLGKNLLNVKS